METRNLAAANFYGLSLLLPEFSPLEKEEIIIGKSFNQYFRLKQKNEQMPFLDALAFLRSILFPR